MTGKSKPGQQSILETSGLKTGFGTDRLRLGAVKMFQDGSIQGYTGYLSKPYHEPFMGDTQYRGYPMRSREALIEMVDEAHRAGKQIAIHGNGDAAPLMNRHNKKRPAQIRGIALSTVKQ